MGVVARNVGSSLGWRPSLPDFRDYTVTSPAVTRLLRRMKRRNKSKTRRPKMDLREFFPPPDDQALRPTATAHAVVGMLEYFQLRSHGDSARLSSWFVYRSACQLLAEQQPETIDFRTLMKAVRNFGAPAARFWHAESDSAADDPPGFLYSLVDKYRELLYVRLDPANQTGTETLELVRTLLAAGFPVVFGLGLPESALSGGPIPYRPVFEQVVRGHALLAVGFDDRHLESTRGALLVRNCWGSSWGEDGYGWLPYAFVEQQLATDFWTVLREDWVDSQEFRRPVL